MADLTKFSTADLQALQSGDLTKVSTEGLQTLHAQMHADNAAAELAREREQYNPTNDMSAEDRAVAGYGSALPNLVRGVGQRLGEAASAAPSVFNAAMSALVPGSGLIAGAFGKSPADAAKAVAPSQANIDEARRLDAPLAATTAGKVGGVAGNVALSVPAMMVPGGQWLAGSVVTGGALGAAQPTATGESALKNAAVGAGLGAAGYGAGKLVGAGVNSVKTLIEPFTAAGPQNIAGRTLQRFASEPASISNASGAPTITGAVPTLAEATGDVGLSRLQDALRSADPQLNNALAARLSANNAARVNKLAELAGEGGGHDFAVANRAGTAGPMYDEAFKVIPDTLPLTPEQSRTLATLMRSPAIKSAMTDARTIAANNGTNVGASNASGSIEGLHNMKIAMDDAISSAKEAGNTALADSIKTAQGKLVGFIEEVSPEYKNARLTYAAMSKPINSMDVAAQVAKRGLSKGTDLASGAQVINRNALLGALQDEPALIRQATGRTGLGNSLSNVMEPADENMLRTIASEADRSGAVATAGNGPGSATAQRLAMQKILANPIPADANPNLLQRATQAIVNSAPGRVGGALLQKPVAWLYRDIAEPRVQQALANAILSPDEARAALDAAVKANVKLPPSLAARLTARLASQSPAISYDSSR